MRSLQESPLGSSTPAVDGGGTISPDPSATEAGQQHHHTKARGSSECRLYRDPSLHRRRTNPRSPSASTSTTSTAINVITTTASQVGFSLTAFLRFFQVCTSFLFLIVLC